MVGNHSRNPDRALKENKKKLPMYLGRYPEFDKTIVAVLKGA
jgi:hypothetical protein